MKFFNIVALASFASATPMPKLEERQQTVTGTILNSVNTLDRATKDNLAAINTAIERSRDNVAADVIVEIQGTLQANYRAIAEALGEAGKSIAAVTTGAAGGIAEQAKGLSRAQLQQLAEAVQASKRIVDGIGATLELFATDLRPEIRDVVQQEANAVRDALGPFIEPLVRFSDAARRASAGANLAVSGLEPALREISGVVNRLVQSLGLPISLPDLSGILGSQGSLLRILTGSRIGA